MQAMAASAQMTSYEPLTPLMAVRLAAPHTWPAPRCSRRSSAASMPSPAGYDFSPLIWCLLLAVAVFAQSAVNTLNDWADYRAGTDTVENSDDPTDAVLVYNNPNPRSVLALGLAYMLVALVCGIICVVWSGSAIPLLIGVVGALFIVCYSSGQVAHFVFPTRRLVSGIVMGALIPLGGLGVFAAHAHPDAGLFGIPWPVDWLRLVSCLAPFVIGIGLVMATQNNCDIERDVPVGRKTLPVVLGRARSVIVYRVFVVLWVAIVLHCAFWYFSAGFWAACVTLVFGIGTMRSLLTTPLTHEVRGPAMGTIMKANLFFNGALIMAMMVSLI